MSSTRIHSAVIPDTTYNRVGKYREGMTKRLICPNCKTYYLRSLWTRIVFYREAYPHRRGKTEIVIGKWCQKCGYFRQTYREGDKK